MKKLILLSILSVLVMSCQKEIEFKGKSKDPVMVLNGVVENDSLFRVYLERSVFFLSSENASVKYISSGALLKVTNLTTGEVYTMNESTFPSPNLYEFPFITTPNTQYKIEVTHPDYPSISAEMITTAKVNLNSVDTVSVIKNQEKLLKITFNWNDPTTENYYMVRVRQDIESAEYSYTNYLYMSSTDLSIDNSTNTDIDGSVYPTNTFLFTDTKFNGQQKSMEFLANYYSPSDDPMNPVDEKVYCELISMNKATYLYYVSMTASLQTDFFSEPVKVLSNINNGFGIFGSLNYSVKKL
ncbi:MAG: hypothetical protein RL264_1731 [Bacteroidota bacterium]|jgi:hypothetical protein